MLCSEGPIDVGCLPPEVLRQPGESNERRQVSEFETAPSAGRDYERQLIVGMLRKYRKVQGQMEKAHAKQVERAWEVVDDFPGEITVLPRELRVIETYLAGVLDEFLEPRRLETGKFASETAKRDVE